MSIATADPRRTPSAPTIADLLGLVAELDLRVVEDHHAELSALAPELARASGRRWWWDDTDQTVVTVRALSRLRPGVTSDAVTRLYFRLLAAS